VTLEISANAFLQHMVRNITGSLVAVGTCDATPQWLGEVLAACDRKKGGVAAPAHGLTFVAVDYPQAFEIPGPLTPY
jgi:tRNA pseudouridine38-40 synthase